ncbi:MAG: hypothetical protein HN742_08960 [Lentisphaerae bacterium]|nr:hypothetical protein [Lentisphaerota bacterium]MBT4823514.1 hypothetical protein [Lentisphaerota bacterium]MBT5606749.1 hypothetical protein [Lentisphaerota bacterium]MBT7054731.1 hypothetical protein [Lentisphaerota bacterium]MBT7841989.1 hypothetical protein [Lentisphaerota bacterium]
MNLRTVGILACVIAFVGCSHQQSFGDAPVVAHWTFDGDLRDASEWGRDIAAKGVRFVPGHRGQALQVDSEYVEVPGLPELELTPGLRLDFWITFAKQPRGYQYIIRKDGEYMLRVDPVSEGGRFSFFVNLGGSWEPRVSSAEAMQTGVWYHVIAQWDGREATLEVNGEEARVARGGESSPTTKPLEIGAFGGMIDDLRIENPVMRKPDTTAPDMLVGHWTFDGGLRDDSGQGHDIEMVGARFVPGHAGSALLSGAEPGLVPSSPDLQLAPNLRIECWVRFDGESADYRPIATKDGEYLLRVDSLPEGGRFAFFVNLNGSWGPKARSSAPMETGVWYHLIAQWDGVEAMLEVNGEKSGIRRSGVSEPADRPLEIGTPGAVIDELRIHNSVALRLQKLRAMAAAAPPGGSQALDHFGQGAGWPGWVGMSGADVTTSGGKLEAVLADSDAMIVTPALDLDLTQRGYVCCDLSCRTARTATLTFVTDAGHGMVPLPLWSTARTSIVDLSTAPNWHGRLKLLAISVPGVRPHDIQLENVWISGKPKGKPFLYVRNLAQGGAILRVGRQEKIIAVVHSLGMEAQGAAARLVLPPGVRSLGDTVRELGAMPTGTTRIAEWTVVADSETSGSAEVVLTAANFAPSSERCRLAFRPAETPLAISVPTTGGTKAVTYYIDSVGGVNANAGTSPDAAWRDFTNINGKTLGPGERLRIKRGSVINQELQVSARGTVDSWAEIGPYGRGARPAIRRNWDIRDRCALIRDPDYLWIHGLRVTCAAKGLIVSYTKSGHAGLLIEDCIASHIEGLYLPDNHGIPEWRGQPGPEGDGASSAGIAVVGARCEGVTICDCEMFHTSRGFRVSQLPAKRAVLDRIFCHGCYAHNTSPHPVLIGGSLVRNSIFDASGGHASRGTMGIMLGSPRGLIFRNCTFRNMPDSGSYDQGGIDFEAGGNGCLIDRCTFENNAGAGVEVLGLKSPQCRNIEIRNSRFIKNNWVKKSHGPAEIYVWGNKKPDPRVCCSTGTIHNNGYVLLPGVEFFVNAAPDLTWWTLQGNVQYATAKELRDAMPHNDPPVVDAGPDLYSDQATVQLTGRASDDGRPAVGNLNVRWEVIEGPANVVFENEAAPATRATFAKPGDYLLRLVGDDGELWLSDRVAVHVLSRGTRVLNAWEFNRQLDKEGWSEADLGTRERKTGSKSYQVSKPVKHVSGGYYIVAVEDSPDAHLLSPDDLTVDLTRHETIRIRFQNHTPATRMRFAFTTHTDPAWSDANSKTFDVVTNDNGPREYSVDMSTVPGWTGRLKRLRLDLATGEALTGTCRIDYIRVDRVAAPEAL